MSAANLVFSNRYGRGSGADASTGAQETGLRQMSVYLFLSDASDIQTVFKELNFSAAQHPHSYEPKRRPVAFLRAVSFNPPPVVDSTCTDRPTKNGRRPLTHRHRHSMKTRLQFPQECPLV